MSVAGDIIDDLKFGPSLKIGAVTGMCATFALGFIIGIGLPASSGVDSNSPIELRAASADKAEDYQSGGTPRPR